ncbi:MAG: hypothetical protein KF888_08300 [Nitrosomonas sp.]|nr:hypothetical protein [Nitrosomonas sp.]
MPQAIVAKEKDMQISAEISFWIGIIGTLVGVIGLGITIYHWAISNENKKRKREIQFILAGVGNLALSKAQAWNNQIGLLPKPKGDVDLETLRVHSKARDDLTEIHSLVSALEGTIDSECSATISLLEKCIKQNELNNKLQTVGLQNPTHPNNQNKQVDTNK